MQDKNVIHRDLKLQNIFLTKNQEVKVGDFGLAKSLTTLDKITNTQCGTFISTAPEILEGKNYNFSADIWSLGCILYELVTGISPFLCISDEKTIINILNCKFKPLPESTPHEIQEVINGCF